MYLEYFNFWDSFALLTLIVCLAVCIYLLARMTWLVVVKYPKEKKEEETLNKFISQIR